MLALLNACEVLGYASPERLNPFQTIKMIGLGHVRDVAPSPVRIGFSRFLSRAFAGRLPYTKKNLKMKHPFRTLFVQTREKQISARDKDTL